MTESGRKKYNVGGQAVLEGVFMRSPSAYAVAVRHPDGRILTQAHPFRPLTKRISFLGLPFLRGAVLLIEMLALGMKALAYSADIAAADPDEGESPEEEAKKNIGTIPIVLTMIGAFALGMLLFVAAPNVLTVGLLDPYGMTEVSHPFVFNIVSGFWRAIFFVVYLLSVSLLPDIRRVFQYHGAEHKTIAAFEAGEDLTPENAQKHATAHARCGTSLIFIVVLISILVFAVVPVVIVALYPPFAGLSIWIRKPIIIFSHILIMPLVGGIAYEMMKLSARERIPFFVKWLRLPGILFQRFTALEPTNEMVDVAIASLKAALAHDSVLSLEFKDLLAEMAPAGERVEEIVAEGGEGERA